MGVCLYALDVSATSLSCDRRSFLLIRGWTSRVPFMARFLLILARGLRRGVCLWARSDGFTVFDTVCFASCPYAYSGVFPLFAFRTSPLALGLLLPLGAGLFPFP